MTNSDAPSARAQIAAHWWRYAVGSAAVLLGSLTLISAAGLNGDGLVARWAALLRQVFGFGVLPVCVVLIGFGVRLIRHPEIAITRSLLTRVVFGELAFIALLALLHSLAVTPERDGYAVAQSGTAGGAVGWVMAELLWRALGANSATWTAGRVVSVVVWMLLTALGSLVVATPWLMRRRQPAPRPPSLSLATQQPATGEPTTPTLPQAEKVEPSRPRRSPPARKPASEPSATPPRRSPVPTGTTAELVIIRSEEAGASRRSTQPRARPTTLPPLDLLKPSKPHRLSEEEVRRQAQVIETTLAQFGLSGKVVEVRRGPAVTQFGVEPGYTERGTQSREKASQRLRAALVAALHDSVVIEVSVDRTTAMLTAPAALMDARDIGFRRLLERLLLANDLSLLIHERDRRNSRVVLEIGADDDRTQKIRAAQINALHRDLVSTLAEQLFSFDDFATSDMLTERLVVQCPAGVAEALRAREALSRAMSELGLAGAVESGKHASQLVVSWQKQIQKVRVGAIAALQNDLALALAATSVRIEAPIPGRGLVGIEVPNAQFTTVDLRSILESDTFRRMAEKSPLTVALGRDVSGAPICADLARMPHLLIAGTTGSGKSVCLSAMIVSLVMNNRPEDLKLVLIDPKMVELSRFAGLPHIIGKPESDLERIPAVLRWVTREMDARYARFAELGARNLQDYNAIMARKKEALLPRIVVLIDELADLMLQSPIDTERTICRLAQMARATGIHLVVATQRPSVDVVTGLIKANFPARISFAVASATDSRVILDQVGAETLLGRGDMLFLHPEQGVPQRVQGCFVSDKELEEIVRWWKRTVEAERSNTSAEAVADAEVPWEAVVAELAAERARGSGRSSVISDSSEDDDLIERAMEIIRSNGTVSTSLLQRKLRIGYPRAARLMEELQEMGYVSAKPTQAGKGRESRLHDDLAG
ncbi:MAG: DNA translocase FtsK [Thermoflexales bacterium]